MKKYIITSILSSLICVASFGQSLKRAYLSHEGILTQYDANHWQQVFSDAVDGDTIYFTPGRFDITNTYTISKSLTLIGSGVGLEDCFNSNIYTDSYTTGKSTKISGGLNVSASCFFEGLYLMGGVSIKGTIDGLTFRRCHFDSNLSSSNANSISNLNLESCYVQTLYCEKLSTSNIHNCYISLIIGAGDKEITFTNCVINSCGSDKAVNSTFVNSIICSPLSGSYTPNYCTFVNCIYYNSDSNSTYTNCWNLNTGAKKTAEELLDGGYLGIDGTIVGPLGGPTPFTMIPNQPYISSSEVTYDVGEKKLNVNITVKKGK